MTLLALMKATPSCLALAEAAGLDETGLGQVLDEAGRLAEDVLVPLGERADREGCRLEAGRVRTPEDYGAVYRQLGADGWIAPDLPSDLGGLGLPLPVQAAATLAFEGAAMPFMMAAGASRAAAHLLAGAAPALAATWAPKLAAGEWTATICISEPGAGSDVGRILTCATETDGGWRIDGTKCWISFGDHDFAERIGHLLLARTGAAREGTRGLSLFLVPNLDEAGAANGVHVERIEDKLGLHGSPTCAMRFEKARGTLIGEPERGLPALFGMIELMRLQVAGQGAGIALRSAAVACAYAGERLQGGPPVAPPVPLAGHPDVQRQLRAIELRAGLAVALVLETATALAEARAGDAEAAARAGFLLPIAKNCGGELGFDAAHRAIQVLGGAGYTRDWPVERYLRDARILTIYEGTRGMQAQDLVLRRLIRDGGAGARAQLARFPGDKGLSSRFAALSETLAEAEPARAVALADAYLRAASACVGAGLAQRLPEAGVPERAVAEWLMEAEAEMAVAERLSAP